MFAALLALSLILIAPQASAAPASSDSSRLGQLCAGITELLMQAQAGAERLVREVPVDLASAQVWGIAAGIVGGAIVADLAGFGGLAALALAAGGGAIGNWLLSEPIWETSIDDET
jgi:hypothetical protein